MCHIKDLLFLFWSNFLYETRKVQPKFIGNYELRPNVRKLIFVVATQDLYLPQSPATMKTTIFGLKKTNNNVKMKDVKLLIKKKRVTVLGPIIS